MWRTLYGIGLALPRILFRPLHEFHLILPESGKPFICSESIFPELFELGQQQQELEKALQKSGFSKSDIEKRKSEAVLEGDMHSLIIRLLYAESLEEFKDPELWPKFRESLDKVPQFIEKRIEQVLDTMRENAEEGDK